jgi:hypothetical protein
MEEILREILRPLTRYSANDPKFPVNDPPLFTGRAFVYAEAETRRRHPRALNQIHARFDDVARVVRDLIRWRGACDCARHWAADGTG